MPGTSVNGAGAQQSADLTTRERPAPQQRRPSHRFQIGRPLMVLRMLPARLLRRATALGSTGPLLDEFVREGFVVLGERPDAELVLGGIGKFWRLVDEDTIRAVETADEFRAFADPGYAKAAVTFLVTAEAGGSQVVTETRIVGTSPEATARFRRYWRVVGPGSALIRRSWLAAIRRRALRG